MNATCLAASILAIAASLSLAPPAGAQAAADSAKSIGPVVLLPGMALKDGALTLHLPGDEYHAGEGWWALACPDRCALFPLTLTVTPKEHPVYDGDPVPGQLLQFAPAPATDRVLAVFALHAARTSLPLQAGALTTYYPGPAPRLRRPASPGTMEGEIELPDGKTARFVPTLILPPPLPPGAPAPRQQGEPVLSLELHMDGRHQVLGQFNFGIEGNQALKPGSYIIWAGDLDGDGKPDFLLNFDFQGSDVALFLSSLAQGDQIVGEAGRFKYFPVESAGC